MKPLHGIACFVPSEVLDMLHGQSGQVQVPVGPALYFVSARSLRYKCFRRDKCRCVCCGLLATQMWLEMDDLGHRGHFNLYAVEHDGLVLFTKDHIIPRALGGKTVINNLQTMCITCNQIKGSSSLNMEQILLLRNLRNV